MQLLLGALPIFSQDLGRQSLQDRGKAAHGASKGCTISKAECAVSPHMLKTTWTWAPHRMPVLSPECTHTAAARPRGSEALTEIQAPSTGQPGHAPQTAHQSGRCPTGQLSNHTWWMEVAVPRGASRALAAPQVNSVQLILWKLERATRSKVRNFT